jgi:hypothetical protein
LSARHSREHSASSRFPLIHELVPKSRREVTPRGGFLFLPPAIAVGDRSQGRA